MGFEELFESSNRLHDKRFKGHYEERHKRDHQDDPYDSRVFYPSTNKNHSNSLSVPYWLAKIRSNRKLRMWIAILGVILVLFSILLIVLFFPLIIKLVNYISQVGIKGVIDGITIFLEKFLTGSGK